MEYDWVTARSQCSLQSAFDTLREVIKTDAQVANRVVTSGQKFRVTSQETKIIVAGTGPLGDFNVVLELRQTDILARRGDSDPIFRCKPHFTSGECMLEIDGVPLHFWQVSMRALERLFFG